MGEFENLEGLCWENFFDQVDKQFNEEEEGESKWNGGGSNEIVAFSGVATLPHDKAVCYGVCTVSQVPKLVKCEDCSLVVKMVGFGHHRKFRHRESRLFLARQSVKDAEDSSNSDSNDDCQGFLLSPPHHHLSVASTSEASSIFEGHQWRTTHPLDPSSTKASSSSLKQTAGSNKQQQPSKTNEPPRLYGVEKWNDLRLVLKRTPEKAASQNAEHQHNSSKNVVEHENVEDVSTKKLRKPPPSRAIGSKRKRKKKTNKRTKESDDDEEVANVEDESPQSAGKVYQPSNNDLQECDTFTDDAEHDDSFVTIPTQLTTPSNDDSFVTIPTQLTPSTAANFWDPREAAGRPDVVKGTFKKTPLSSKLTSSHSAPIRKTTLNLSVKQFQQATSFTSANLIQTNMESNKRDTNLDKIAGPSILKRPGQLTSPPQYHHQQNIHKNEEKSVGSVQQIYNKYSGINYKNPEQEQPQNLNLQNQFSKMQQQIQKQRGLTRDFDAISPKSNRKTTPEEVDRPDSRHSPSSDTSSSTSNIYMDSQESATLTKSTNDSTCHSNFVNKLPNNVVQSNEFSRSTQFIHEAISNSQKPPTMFRLLGRTPTNTGSNENKTTTIIVKNSPNNNAQWKGTDSNSSNSPISTPQQRKISSASFSGRSHYISPSGTRFVPVDPRGLVSMQKNSASNSITSSKSNSPIAAIPSTPSPASYINSPPRCEIINPNVDIRTPRGETNQNIFGVDYEQQHQFISSTPKTINNIISSSTITTTTANRRQPQHFPSTNQTNSNFFRKRQIVEEMTPQALMTSTPNRYQQQQRTPTSSITHSNIKRFRPVMASQEGDHQQYACIDSFPSDTPILHPPRVRTLYPQKQQHSTISASPIPGTSTSMVDIQQPTCYQISYQNQIVNQRIHPSSSQQHFTTSNTLGQQHPPSQPFRQAFTSTIQQQQRQQHHYLRQQQHNLRTQLNRGINTSTYFPKSLSSLSGEFALEHQQQHYSQRHQQQFNINSPTEDPPFNEYIIGSPPPSEQQQHFPERIAATSGLYEQKNPSRMNIMRRADQQQQLLPSPYNYSTTPTSTPTTIRRLPVINPQQQMQINHPHQQQHFILPSSSNRFTSSTNIAHNNNNLSVFLQQQTNIPMDYNNLQQHAHQQLSYHQRATTMTEYRPGMEPIDTHAIDPPPILEAEGRLSVMETISSSTTSIPSVYNRQQQLGVVCSNESNISSTSTNLATPNKNSNNEEDAGTRSSSASDLDLREIVNNNNIPSSQ